MLREPMARFRWPETALLLAPSITSTRSPVSASNISVLHHLALPAPQSAWAHRGGPPSRWWVERRAWCRGWTARQEPVGRQVGAHRTTVSSRRAKASFLPPEPVFLDPVVGPETRVVHDDHVQLGQAHTCLAPRSPRGEGVPRRVGPRLAVVVHPEPVAVHPFLLGLVGQDVRVRHRGVPQVVRSGRLGPLSHSPPLSTGGPGGPSPARWPGSADEWPNTFLFRPHPARTGSRCSRGPTSPLWGRGASAHIKRAQPGSRPGSRLS